MVKVKLGPTPFSVSSLALRRPETFIFLGLLALSSLVFWQWGIDQQPITPDRSLQLYAAQEILRGHPPYVAVVIAHTPLTGLTSALAMATGNLLGIMDVMERPAPLLSPGFPGGGLHLSGGQSHFPRHLATVGRSLDPHGLLLLGVVLRRRA